jgi:CheY-like chemotaxis protein
MSAILDSLLDDERRAACRANDEAMAMGQPIFSSQSTIYPERTSRLHHAEPARSEHTKEYTVDDEHNNDQHQPGLRILVVDDNHDGASSMSMLLELEGHRTGTAHNGLEAVREATRVRYDAVLLDLGMPVMDGFEAAAVLRQLWPAPALIACSAWDDAETRRRTADLGFSMHLRKPVSVQVLKAALRELPPPPVAWCTAP